MSCEKHEQHQHTHAQGCGHTAIKHGDHIDYVHNGHLHHPHGDHVDEHVLEVNDTNPERCTPPASSCGCGCCQGEPAPDQPTCHTSGHTHGDGCGHEAVPHGDHVDYIVNGRLHHPHGNHCDDHGPVEVVA